MRSGRTGPAGPYGAGTGVNAISGAIVDGGLDAHARTEPRDFRSLPVIRQSFFEPVEKTVAEFARLGDVPMARLGLEWPFRVAFVRDPDLIEEVYRHPVVGVQKSPHILGRTRRLMREGTFISSGFDRDWLHRRAMSGPPVLRADRLRALLPRIETLTADGLDRHLPAGTEVELARAVRRYVTDLTFRLFFSHDLGPGLDDVVAWTECLEDEFQKTSPWWIPSPSNARYLSAARGFAAFAERLVAERRASPPDRPDVLSPLYERDCPHLGRRYTDAEIRDELFSVFFGASAMATPIVWVLNALARDAALLRRVRDEVASAGALDVRGVDALPLLDAVIRETARLYPTFWCSVRYTREAVALAGHRFPAKTMFVLMRYLAHRHPAHWPEPEAFDVERFLDGSDADAHPASHFEYGRGPRVCVGRRVAPLTIKMTLARLLSDRTPVLGPAAVGAPSVRFGFGTYPDRPIPLTFSAARSPAGVATAADRPALATAGHTATRRGG